MHYHLDITIMEAKNVSVGASPLISLLHIYMFVSYLGIHGGGQWEEFILLKSKKHTQVV